MVFVLKEGSKVGVPLGWRRVCRPVRGNVGPSMEKRGPALLPSRAARLVPASRRRELVVCGVSGVGRPAAPLGLCAGGETADAGPCIRQCPRRSSGRPIVPRCHTPSTGVQFAFVECALSRGKAHRSVRQGVGGEFA